MILRWMNIKKETARPGLVMKYKGRERERKREERGNVIRKYRN